MPVRSDVLLLDTIVRDATRFIDVLIDRAVEHGAIDAWTTPVSDRHGRPAVRLTLVVPAARRECRARAHRSHTGPHSARYR